MNVNVFDFNYLFSWNWPLISVLISYQCVSFNDGNVFRIMFHSVPVCSIPFFTVTLTSGNWRYGWNIKINPDGLRNQLKHWQVWTSAALWKERIKSYQSSWKLRHIIQTLDAFHRYYVFFFSDGTCMNIYNLIMNKLVLLPGTPGSTKLVVWKLMEAQGCFFNISVSCAVRCACRNKDDTPGPCQYTPSNPTAISERRSIGEKTAVTLGTQLLSIDFNMAYHRRPVIVIYVIGNAQVPLLVFPTIFVSLLFIPYTVVFAGEISRLVQTPAALQMLIGIREFARWKYLTTRSRGNYLECRMWLGWF